MGEVAGFGALASALLEIVGGLLIASFGAYDLFLSGKPERPFLSLVLLLAGVGGAVWQGRKKLLPALGASGLRLNKRHVLIGGGLALAVFVIWVYSGPSGPVGQRGAAPAPSGPVVMTTVNRLHWIALFLIAATVLSLGRLLGLQSDPATLAGRRLANGLATLAVFAFVWKSLADDFGSPGSPLYFFIECFRLIAVNPGVYVPLVALPVVAAISAARAFVGFFGPFPPGQRHMGGAIVTLAICAAAWVFGLFVPPSWGLGRSWGNDQFRAASLLPVRHRG